MNVGTLITKNLCKIASCNGLTQQGEKVALDIYKLGAKDEKVINKMLTKSHGNIQGLYESALNQAKAGNDVFVALNGKKPCGIIAAMKEKDENSYCITNFATWAIKPKNIFSKKTKIKNAGEGLLETTLREAQKEGVNNINLSSTTGAIDFYKKSGFVPQANKLPNILEIPSLAKITEIFQSKLEQLGMHFFD